MSNTHRQDLRKFNEYASAEPRLKDLYLQIKSADEKDIKEYGLVTRMWLEKFKPQLVQMIGCKRPFDDELATEEAYKIAYNILFNALPMEKSMKMIMMMN